jgi:uncharacterized membrane protein
MAAELPEGHNMGSIDQGLGKTRMEALSDGIFSVALTVLVLEIGVPNFGAAN